VQRSVTLAKQNVDGADFQGVIVKAPAPTISFVTPTATFAGNSTLSIRILGSNFTPTSVVRFNGQALVTTFVSSVEMQAIVTPDLLRPSGAYTVTVETPEPGGGVSKSLTFNVQAVTQSPLVEGRAGVGAFPAGVAIDTSRKQVLITNQSSDSVTIL